MAVQDVYNAVIHYDRAGVAELTRAELAAGRAVLTILNEGLIAPMDEVGRKYAEGALYLPEMLMAGQTMQAGLGVLKPVLADTKASYAGTVVIGTVKGDLHDIGKNLVAMILEGAGFQVFDLGVDVAKGRFVEAARARKADLVALSALLTTTMPAMAEITAAVKEQAAGVRVIVGGAPVTRDFAGKIGADGYAQDGPGAVELSRNLLKS
ncbi:MAG: corrinoid protein [Thermodesulfobacteriota bacterium]